MYKINERHRFFNVCVKNNIDLGSTWYSARYLDFLS